MNRLLELLRALGTAGAVTNARALSSARRREDRVVASLERHLARSLPTA